MMYCYKYFSILFFLGIFYQADGQNTNLQIDCIDALDYHFYIQINDIDNSIKVVADEKILIKKQIDTFYLDFMNTDKGKGLQVKKIEDNKGRKIDFLHQNNKLYIKNSLHWNSGDTVKLSISYSGEPIDGLYIKQNMYDQKTFFGDNWPNRARYWLPVVDHLSDKARVGFTIQAPDHYAVIASGKFIFKKNMDLDKIVYSYQSAVPLPTKVMVFAAADFRIKEYADKSGVKISSWVFDKAPLEADNAYKPAVKVFDYYSNLIGPFSFEKLANVQSKTRFGGMENAGNIFYTENSVLGGQKVEALIAHEVAHQWFGDAVTEKNWKDIWLSEGFATYLTDLYFENKEGRKKLASRLQMERDKVIRYSHNTDVQAVVYTEKDNLFKLLNRNSYEKGAWILHMLRVKIGDKRFFKLLRTFYKKYTAKNAGTDDFIALAEQISHTDLQDFFNQWLYRKTIPKLQIHWRKQNDKLYIDVTQKGDIYDLKLPITLLPENSSERENHCLHITKQKQEFVVKTGSDYPLKKLLIDPEVVVLFEIIP